MAANNSINVDIVGQTTRKMLVSNGTTFLASTETWAVPGTSGNILQSDGTNWTSAASSGIGNLLSASVQLTSAQVKALHGTPIQLIAAPGAGKGIVYFGATAKLNYGGTNVFTAAASQTIGLFYNNTTNTIISGANFVPNAMIVSSANKFTIAGSPSFSFVNTAAGVLDNVNVAIYNSVATEIAGNAAGDNTIDVTMFYAIVTF